MDKKPLKTIIESFAFPDEVSKLFQEMIAYMPKRSFVMLIDCAVLRHKMII